MSLVMQNKTFDFKFNFFYSYYQFIFYSFIHIKKLIFHNKEKNSDVFIIEI